MKESLGSRSGGTALVARVRRVWREVTGEAGVAGAAGGGWWRVGGQFVYFVARGFIDNRCPMRAAALAYTTLLALVPLLAVAFSLSQGFLHASSAEVVPRLLDKGVAMIAPELQYLPAEGGAAGPGQVVVSAQARREVVAKIQQFIGNIDAGALGAVGSALLVVVAIRLLMTIEETLNDIWGVREGRSIWRKIVYYWSTITLGPLLLIAAIGMTGTVEFSRLYGRLSFAPATARVLLQLVPFVLLWVGFTLFYALMPNTAVRPRAAMMGGLVGGTLWQLNSLLSTLYLSRVVTYSKIYGGLGIIPVFLAGLYLAWFNALLGAQVAYATQTFYMWRQRRSSQRLDQAGRELLGCRLVLLVCRGFLGGATPLTVGAAGERLGASLPLLQGVVSRLIEGGVLAETGDDRRGLLPARSVDLVTVADVLQLLRTSGGAADEPGNGGGAGVLEPVLAALCAAERTASANLTFRELAARPEAAAS